MKKCALGIMVFLVCLILTMGLSAAQDLIYVVERGSGELSVVDEDGQITLLTSGLQDPLDVEILPNGNLLVSERVNTSSSTGYLTEINLDGFVISHVYPGFSPNDIFIDDDGTIYVTSYYSGIWKKDSAGFTQFSTVPGDLTDMVRLGDYFYVTNVAGGNALYRIVPDTGSWTRILSGFSSPLGLAVIGEDLLVAEYGTNQIRRATNVAPDPPSPTVSLFAWNLPQASSFTLDDEGNFILSHQKTPGRISKVNAFGNVTTFVNDTSLLSNPRGLVFSSGVIEVTIDIKPGSDPNSINLGEHGLLPVAILGSADFDVETIDPTTIEIEGVTLAARGSKKAPKLACSVEYVNDDVYEDMMIFFDVQLLVTEGVLTAGTTELSITANLKDGTPIEGTDSVNIVH